MTYEANTGSMTAHWVAGGDVITVVGTTERTAAATLWRVTATQGSATVVYVAADIGDAVVQALAALHRVVAALPAEPDDAGAVTP